MQAHGSFRGRPGHQNRRAAGPARPLQSQEKKASHRVLLALEGALTVMLATTGGCFQHSDS